jgi:hypothetical protein
LLQNKQDEGGKEYLKVLKKKKRNRISHEPEMVAHVCNPALKRVRQNYYKFQASLATMVRLCLVNK